MHLYLSAKQIIESPQEFTEQKGPGHPDTLSDGLAERLSVAYSKYTLDRYGAVLHHNFDKVGLLGGSSYVAFGRGYLTAPIRVLLNGRASVRFGDEAIPTKQLLLQWTKEYLGKQLPLIDPERDLEFHFNLSTQSSPGKTEMDSKSGRRKFWFEPRSLDDLQELIKPGSNDTAVGVGYAPRSTLERLVLDVAASLDDLRETHRWMGSDIKIMGFRDRCQVSMTICIPQIANCVFSVKEYRMNLKQAEAAVREIAQRSGVEDFQLFLNTRDDFDCVELYLTAIGSSIESGDEGLVGRGNRTNGLISPGRPMSIDAACGKNPVYHIGKIYNVAACALARGIYDTFGIANEVYIASQSGRNITDPWKAVVYYQEGFRQTQELKEFVESHLAAITILTPEILAGDHRLY